MDQLENIGNGICATKVLAGNYTIPTTDPIISKLDPNGTSREVYLEGVLTPGTRGRLRYIVNAASDAHTLTVKDKSGGTTIGTILQNQSGLFSTLDDGANAGKWTLVHLFTIVLS